MAFDVANQRTSQTGTDSVVIIPMKRRHLRSVIRIENKVFPRPWTVGLFMSEISTPTGRAYYIAKIGPRVVGYCGMIMTCGEAHITNIAVDPEWGRRHIASRMMVQMIRTAIANETLDVTLEVRMSNRSAQSLYYRFGFAPGGVRKNYYPETNEDALIMWVHDIGSPNYEVRLQSILSRIGGKTTWAQV